jgi:hypothetical protein
MTDKPPGLGEHAKEHAGNSPLNVPEPRYFSYYRDSTEGTGGMKVKWTVRVIAGDEAADLDARQNAAIWELLQWARHYRQGRP